MGSGDKEAQRCRRGTRMSTQLCRLTTRWVRDALVPGGHSAHGRWGHGLPHAEASRCPLYLLEGSTRDGR